MAYFDGKFSVRHNKLLYEGQNVEFFQSANYSNGEFNPKYLVLHYTASPSLDSSVNWFKKDESKASAHFLIDFDGRIIQSARLNQIAWHAGKSYYKGEHNLNKLSIGIELVNYGHMDIIDNGKYRTWFGKTVRDGEEMVASSGELFYAETKEGPHSIIGGNFGWVMATPEQIESTIMLGSFLMDKYNLEECVGHDEISRGRKYDPGETISKSVFSRIENRKHKEYNEFEYIVSVNSNLNMRSGPGTEYDIVATLENGDAVEVNLFAGDNNEWAKISTSNEKMEGWVYSGFINKAR